MSNKLPTMSCNQERRRVIAGLAAAFAGSALQGVGMPAYAQPPQYPSKPVRILLGYPPGGSADVMTRLIADQLQKGFGQPVIVENRPGASGNIAAHQAAQAQADGYTILFGNPAEIAINKLIMKNMSFDPDVDFLPVVRVFNVPLALVVPKNSPFKSLGELLAASRKEKDKYFFASAGSGSPGHLAGESLAMEAKISLTHVPYKGAGPALADLIGGHVDCYFAGLTAVVPHLQSGAIRVLALSSLERSSMMPDVPTVAELAVPNFEFTLWGGLFVHKDTPAEIIQKLSKVSNAAFQRPEVKERMATEYSEVVQNSPEDFKRFVQAQTAKYAKIIKETGYTSS